MRSEKRRALPHAPCLITKGRVWRKRKSTYCPSSEMYFSQLCTFFSVCHLLFMLYYNYCVLTDKTIFRCAALAQPFPSACHNFSWRFPAPTQLGARGFFSYLIPYSSRRKAGASLLKPCAGLFLWSRADRVRVSRSMINSIFFNPK